MIIASVQLPKNSSPSQIDHSQKMDNLMHKVSSTAPKRHGSCSIKKSIDYT